MKPKMQMDDMISSQDSNELINVITHLAGALLSIAGMVVLIVLSARQQKWLHLTSFAIYGSTVIASFTMSTVLHFFLLFKRYSKFLGMLDHSAIYLLIAGTYTPICLAVVGGGLGWTIFGVIWGLAIINIVLKCVFFSNFPTLLSILGYLLMGWLSISLVYNVFTKLGFTSIIVMMIGGLSFTIGAIIFIRGKPNPFPPFLGNHEIWHIMVLIGNLSFYFLMLLYVLPYSRI